MFTYVCFLVSFTALATSQSASSEGHCIWYGQIGKKNYQYEGPPKPLSNETARAAIAEMCPDLAGSLDSGLCCDAAQIATFKKQMAQADALIGGCPACRRNFAQLFCYSTCHPAHSNFLEVNEIFNNTVSSITYYVSNEFASGMYNSCSSMGVAMFLLCGFSYSCDPITLLGALGDQAPFKMQFRVEEPGPITTATGTFQPMNGQIVPCDQTTPEGKPACECASCRASCTTGHAAVTTPEPSEDDSFPEFQ